ncbi:DOC family protein [Phyllosticta capitalensis]
MASKTLRFLSSSQVMMLHVMRIARATPLQPGLLKSAVLSPINTNSYDQQDDVFHLAAILSQKIMKNHAFRDGNKRTALIAADVFLQMNGFHLRPAEPSTPEEGYQLTTAHVKVASNRMTVEELAEFYRETATRAEECRKLSDKTSDSARE